MRMQNKNQQCSTLAAARKIENNMPYQMQKERIKWINL